MDPFDASNRTRHAKTSFVIDFATKDGTDMKVLDAYGFIVTETGDLLFYDQEGYPFDMWAAGYWLRCKLSRAE